MLVVIDFGGRGVVQRLFGGGAQCCKDWYLLVVDIVSKQKKNCCLIGYYFVFGGVIGLVMILTILELTWPSPR